MVRTRSHCLLLSSLSADEQMQVLSHLDARSLGNAIVAWGAAASTLPLNELVSKALHREVRRELTDDEDAFVNLDVDETQGNGIRDEGTGGPFRDWPFEARSRFQRGTMKLALATTSPS